MSKDTKKKTLRDDDIRSRIGFGRRRLLAGLAVGGAGLTVAGCQTGSLLAEAGTTDGDNGSITDPVGGGRGYCRATNSGVTDSDDGAIADPLWNGRGGPAQRRAGVTDGDAGTNADPIGEGRGRFRSAESGVTDSDAGGVCVDPVGNGRNL